MPRKYPDDRYEATARCLNSRGYASFVAITDSHSRILQSDARCPGNSGHVSARTAESAGSWTNAIDLNVGDALTTADGTAARVISTTTRASTDWAYNLTIAKTHTYYVGEQPVLVHNASCKLRKVSLRFNASGREMSFGSNLRVSPLGNWRADKWAARLPHWHLRKVDAHGTTIPGQGIGWHRPWERSAK